MELREIAGILFSAFLFLVGLPGHIEDLQAWRRWLGMPVGTTKWTIWNYSFVGAALIGVLISVGSILHNHGVFLLEETPESVTLPRPYFTLTHAGIQGVSQDDPVLRVVVQNNDVVAGNVVTRLLISEESLDPIIEPLYDGIEEDANPVGPNSPLNVELPIDPKWNMHSLFVVLQVQYTGSLSGKTYSQPFFLKYATGKQFSRADMDEKTRIERYMKERGIPLL